ncbi:MAG: hypothetical protein RR404_02745 [Bacilli bacterium]
MKKMLKNKAVIGLFILMLGFTYIKSTPNNTLEATKNNDKEVAVFQNKQ